MLSVRQMMTKRNMEALEALSKLNFKVFNDFVLDAKSNILDEQIYSICILLIRQYVDDHLFKIIKMEESKQEDAMKITAKFEPIGQCVSFEDATIEDSCISFVSGVVKFDHEKYIPEEESTVNPLDKKC